MTDEPVTFHGGTSPQDAGSEPVGTNTTWRRPAAKHGLRVALLAGIITATSGVTTGLGSPINSAAGPMDTTCCGSGQAVSYFRPPPALAEYGAYNSAVESMPRSGHRSAPSSRR
jgi:hypothetical protein